MNTIGIDYEQTLSVVCLGEGSGGFMGVRNVGDGLRSIIPNAVHGEDLWGSRALEAGAKIADVVDGPWLAEPDASQFWLGLYQRLYAFSGRIAPTSKKGYRLVAGLQAVDWRAATEGVERLCGQAGFGDPTCISATDALLARHLAERRRIPTGDTVITAVAVGDTSTAVCSYRLRRDAQGAGLPRLLARDSTPRHLPYGHAHWAGRLLVNISDLFTEPIHSGYDLAMRDSALEFGSRLRRAPAGRAVTWTGPLRDKLYTPLELTVADCCAWPEAAPLVRQLPDMIRESAAALEPSGGRAARPDLILVGGVGALWPFAVIAAATVGPVQQSNSPEEDVARGAALWPEVETLWSHVAPMAAISSDLFGLPMLTAPVPDWEPTEPGGILSDLALVESDGLLQPTEERPSFFASESGKSLGMIETPPEAQSELLAAGAFRHLVEFEERAPSPPGMSGDRASLSGVESMFPLDPPLGETDSPMPSVFSPFDPLAANRDALPAVSPTADEGERSAHVFVLPSFPPPMESDEQADLEDLPPWGSRRNSNGQ